MKATTAIAIFQVLANLEWRELNDQDHMTFNGAGEHARIADLTEAQTGDVNEHLDTRSAYPFLAIIGGDEDHEQLELHGMTRDGDPIAMMLPIEFMEA